MFINILTAADWVIGLCKRLFMLIDAIIYQVLAAFYNIFLAIIRVDFSSMNAIFDNVLTRIYLVLSIFMLFMVSFKLLQWLAEPDKAKSESNKLVRNVFLSIVMLIGCPLVFDLLHDIQTAIIDNNIVQTVILGDSASKMDDEAAGPAFSWTLLKAFVHPTTGDDWCSGSSNVCDAYEKIWVCQGDGSDCDFSLMQLAPIVADTNISYTPIISTVVGIVAIFFLITFSLEIGLRTFKLIFMEAIAPIPIISYMNPGKGEQTFNKFKDEYIKTYLDLFIRMAVVYLVLLLANRIMTMVSQETLVFELGKGGSQLKGLPLALASVMLVFALFTFAKQIPDLIKNILGVQGFGGNFDNTVSGAMTRLGLGAAGLVGGAVGGGVGSLSGSLLRGDMIGEDGKLSLGGVGKVLGNAGSGMLRGGYSTAKNGLGTSSINAKNAGQVFKGLRAATAGAVTAQALRSANTTAAGGWWNATKARAYNAVGGAALMKGRDVRATNAGNRIINGIQNSAGYKTGQTNLDAAKKTFEKAQTRFSESSQYSSDLQRVRNAVVQSYATKNGMTIDQAQMHLANMDNAVFNERAANDANVSRAIQEFNDKHADHQLEINPGSGYDFASFESQAIADRSAASADLTTATNDQKAAQAVMDSYQKQIDDANKMIENHGFDVNAPGGQEKLDRFNQRLEHSNAVRRTSIDDK